MPNLAIYTPSIFAFLLACVFISFPALAVLLVSGALIGFAVIYATMIHRLTSLRGDIAKSLQDNPGFKKDTFKTVTVQMFEKGGTWIKKSTGF